MYRYIWKGRLEIRYHLSSSSRCHPYRPGDSFSKVKKHFGWHYSLCIFKTKASRGTKLSSYFYFYSLYNVWKDQLYRINRSEFYEWLFGPQALGYGSYNLSERYIPQCQQWGLWNCIIWVSVFWRLTICTWIRNAAFYNHQWLLIEPLCSTGSEIRHLPASPVLTNTSSLFLPSPSKV